MLTKNRTEYNDCSNHTDLLCAMRDAIGTLTEIIMALGLCDERIIFRSLTALAYVSSGDPIANDIAWLTHELQVAVICVDDSIDLITRKLKGKG